MLHKILHFLHEKCHRFEPFVHLSYCAAVFGEQTFQLHFGLYPAFAGLLALIILFSMGK